MTDIELVYALYVQANPIPEPDLLPLTQAEAELLTLERSPGMETQERIHPQPAPPVPRRRRLAFGLAAVLVVAAAAAAITLFVAGGGDDPVAAADAAPRITFDGTTCRYDGPTLIEEGAASVTLVNTSTDPINVMGFNIPESELGGELARTPLGIDMALTPAEPVPAGTMAFSIKANPGSEGGGPGTFLAGTHVIDCLYYEPPNDLAPAHVWRAQTTIKVATP